MSITRFDFNIAESESNIASKVLPTVAVVQSKLTSRFPVNYSSIALRPCSCSCANRVVGVTLFSKKNAHIRQLESHFLITELDNWNLFVNIQ